jgi:hypothetical protein
MQTGAVFSPCKTHRYALWRRWSDAPPVLFVMLNPSRADRNQDDPTIRRCISFAKQWGHGGIIVGNLFAFRSPYPKDLQTAPDPIGSENNQWLQRLATQSTTVVGAWGHRGTYMNRGQDVAALFPDLLCLGTTKQGQPRHPLYVAASTSPVPFARFVLHSS